MADAQPEMRTRILVIDDEVFHVVYRKGGVLFARRLEGEERRFALEHLDDAHADVSAHLTGYEPG